MIHLNSGEDSRDAIFGDSDTAFHTGPDPADISLPATQPIDISAHLRAAGRDGSVQ